MLIMRKEITMLNDMVEDINDKWDGMVEARERDGYLFLRAFGVQYDVDTETLEDTLYNIIEDLRYSYNVDFDVEFSRGQTMVLSVIY